MMMKLINVLILSCRQATESMERSLEAKLGVIERIQLYMHKKMCDGCRQYEIQNLFIDKVLRQSASTPSTQSQPKTLSDNVKLKIIRKLHEY